MSAGIIMLIASGAWALGTIGGFIAGAFMASATHEGSDLFPEEEDEFTTDGRPPRLAVVREPRPFDWKRES